MRCVDSQPTRPLGLARHTEYKDPMTGLLRIAYRTHIKLQASTLKTKLSHRASLGIASRLIRTVKINKLKKAIPHKLPHASKPISPSSSTHPDIGVCAEDKAVE